MSKLRTTQSALTVAAALLAAATTTLTPANASTVTSHTMTAYALDLIRAPQLGDYLVYDPGDPWTVALPMLLSANGSFFSSMSASYQSSLGVQDVGSVGASGGPDGVSADILGFVGPRYVALTNGQQLPKTFVIEQTISYSGVDCRTGCTLPDPDFVRIHLESDSPLGTLTRIGAVPEPASWAMLLLGFCAIGFRLAAVPIRG